MSVALLHLLKAQRHQWLTVEAMRTALRLSPPVILQQIDDLRRMGHRIEMAPAYGFRLSDHVGKLTSELIEHGLQTSRIGRKILVYESTDSTNDVAWHYAREDDGDGLAVFAECQRIGRGRFQRRWDAPPGSSILCSVLVQNISSHAGRKLTLLAGLSAAEAVETVCSLSSHIKWPNDVTAGGRKLAGIMVESRKINNHFASVIGIGINCRQSDDDFAGELRDSAVSIRQLINADVDRLQLAQQLLQRLDYWISPAAQENSDNLHDRWLARCDEIGRRISLTSDGRVYTGRVIDVSIEQGLLVRLDNGPIKVFDPATTSINQ